MVASLDMNRFGALGSIEIGNGFAGRATAESAAYGAGDVEGYGEAEGKGERPIELGDLKIY